MAKSSNYSPRLDTPRGKNVSLWQHYRSLLIKDAFVALNSKKIEFEASALRDRMFESISVWGLRITSAYDLGTSGGPKSSEVVTDEQIAGLVDSAVVYVQSHWDPQYVRVRSLAAATKYSLIDFEKLAGLTIADQVKITGMTPRAVSYMRAKVKNLADPQVRELHEKARDLRARWESRRRALILRNKRFAAGLRAKARQARERMLEYVAGGTRPLVGDGHVGWRTLQKQKDAERLEFVNSLAHLLDPPVPCGT